MPEVRLEKDELYPVYFVSEYGRAVELSPAELERVEAAGAEWDAVQEMLHSRFEDAVRA